MRVADIIEEAKDGEELKLVKSLERDFKDGRGRSLIEKLRAIEKTLDPQAAPALCIAVAKLADMIPIETGFFGSGPHSQAGILISFLIARVTDNMKRIAIAKLVVEAANPVWFGAECISWMHVSDEADKADHNTLTADETAEVRKVLIVRIKDRSADGFPLFDGDVRQESSLLYEWWRGEGREPVQSHLLKVFERDPNMICKFLQAMAPQKWGADDVIARVGDLDERNLKNIDLIFDLGVLAVLIRKYCSGNFDSEEWLYDNNRPVGQRLAEQFMFIYKRRKRTAA